MSAPVLVMRDIRKTYDGKRMILDGLNFVLPPRCICAVIGASGSGKSTLLNIMGLLDNWTSGSYHFEGREVSRLKDSQRSLFRNQHVGFVFQDYCLLPNATVAQNLLLPVLYSQEKLDGRIDRRLNEILGTLALGALRNQNTCLLSGGERQRVALGRALMLRPALLIADEPTGNLDEDNSRIVLEQLVHCKSQNCSVVIVTHDLRLAAKTDLTYRLAEGVLQQVV